MDRQIGQWRRYDLAATIENRRPHTGLRYGAGNVATLDDLKRLVNQFPEARVVHWKNPASV